MSGSRHTTAAKARAVAIYQTQGSAQAAETLGVSKRTILTWAKDAGATSREGAKRTAEASRVQRAWGDFREGEALAAGEAAGTLRGKVLDADKSRDAKDWAIAYGIFIDKAELLSGRATSRVETWAESEVDAELRRGVREFEQVTRQG